jgi:iron complex transport system substrate-binding protein
MRSGLKLKLAAILLLFFIGISSAGALDTQTVTDLAGRNVTVPRNPQRIVCIAPGTLRLIVYLQAHDRLVGIEDLEKKFPTTRPYYIANPQMAQLPSVGPGGPNTINKEPDYEKILRVNPDVIFVSYMEAGLADQVQQKIGIPVFILTYGPFGTFNDQVFDSIQAAGRVMGREQRADAVVTFIRNMRSQLDKRTAGIPDDRKPWIYIGGIGFKGTHGIESTETDYAPATWLGAKNIARTEGQSGHLFIDRERLLKINPDIVFIDGGGQTLVQQDYEKRPGYYQGLKAFQNKRVYTLHSFNWYMTNLGTVIVDAFAMGKILYPRQFEDVDMAVLADEVYTFLLGRPVFTELKQINGDLGQLLSCLETH